MIHMCVFLWRVPKNMEVRLSGVCFGLVFFVGYVLPRSKDSQPTTPTKIRQIHVGPWRGWIATSCQVAIKGFHRLPIFHSNPRQKPSHDPFAMASPMRCVLKMVAKDRSYDSYIDDLCQDLKPILILKW